MKYNPFASFGRSRYASEALLFLTAALHLLRISGVIALVQCNDTAVCENLLRPGSICGANGLCTNPFSSGCLRRVLGVESYPNLRVCNSEDVVRDGSASSCSLSTFNHYSEIRVSPGNWETAMFFGWIIQILLSERLGVPVTIETSSDEGSLNFYDIENSFSYPRIGYNFDALQEGNRVGDCAKSDRNVGCAHVMPEVWNGQDKAWTEAQNQGYIEPPEGNGMVGKVGWYIPKFVAERFPSLVSHHGLSNDRAKLAELFNRPTTWLEYCRYVSPTNCSNVERDGVAGRWPVGASEETSFFGGDSFLGYFRPTDKNNCTINPDSCTGHIVDAPCTWSTNTESQAYWNNISLESDGPLQPNGGYSYSQMIQIWKAANATKSNVIMWWWRPDATIQAFRGSQAEFHPVLLPEATEKCADMRIGSEEERCSSDVSVRRGSDPAGSCDSEAHALQKIITKSLYDDTYSVPAASKSPAYATIKSLRLSDLQVDDILKSWTNRGIDKYGYDGREAVCSWVAENIQDLERFFPSGFPRVVQEEGMYRHGFLYGAQAIGIFAVLVVLGTAAFTYRWRKRRVIVYANPNFLLLILLGFLMVSIGAILFVLEPSLASCVSKQWTVTLGYTLGLVPLLVKVAAINKIVQSSARMKRVYLSPRYLFGVVAAVVAVVLLYLVVWTALDPPTRGERRELAKESGNVVEISLNCSSSSDVWTMLALAWELLLLVCASVLAFQARNVHQEFNESRSLGAVVYVHFLFMLLRGITYLLTEMFSSHVRSGITSFLLSFDTLFTLIIYFCPKLWKAATNQNKEVRRQALNVFDKHTTSAPSALINSRPRCSDPSLSRVAGSDGQGQLVEPFPERNKSSMENKQVTTETFRKSFSSWLQDCEGKIEEEYESKLEDMWGAMETKQADQIALVRAEADADLRQFQDRTIAALERLEADVIDIDAPDVRVQHGLKKAREEIDQARQREIDLERFEEFSTSSITSKSESSASPSASDSELGLQRMSDNQAAKIAYLSFAAIGEF